MVLPSSQVSINPAVLFVVSCVVAGLLAAVYSAIERAFVRRSQRPLCVPTLVLAGLAWVGPSIQQLFYCPSCCGPVGMLFLCWWM